MTKLWWFVTSILVAIVLVLTLLKSQAVDWSRTYDAFGKEPFGTWIAIKSLSKMKGVPVQVVTVPMDKAVTEVSTDAQWWICVNEFSPSHEELDSMLRWIRRGGNMVLLARELSGDCADSLGVTIQWYFQMDTTLLSLFDGNEASAYRNVVVGTEYIDRNLVTCNDDAYLVDEDSSEFAGHLRSRVPVADAQGFGDATDGDRLSVVQCAMHPIEHLETIICTQSFDGNWLHRVAVRRRIGAGSVAIVSAPDLLSNISFLTPTMIPAANNALLAFVDLQREQWWDVYQTGIVAGIGPSDVLLQSPAVVTSLALVAVAALMYTSTNIRRRQRAIRVIRPVENTTAEFVRTVANVAQSQRDYVHAIRMRANNIKRYCASVLGVHIDLDSNDTIGRLVAISGCSTEEVHSILEAVLACENAEASPIQSQDAVKYSQLFDMFYQKVQR